LIVLVISRHRALGVDVVNLRARQVSDGVADRFFAACEVAELAVLKPERRLERFFEYWTLNWNLVKKGVIFQ
jgi:4'-phosphopantetheinyl transferase